MSHQDQEGRKCRFNAEYLKRALQWLLRSVTWSSVACRSDCSWAVPQLVAAALVWAWSDELTLADRFRTARKIIQFLFAPQQEPATSYQAFVKLLRRWTGELVRLLQSGLRQLLPRVLADRWRLYGFVVFGVDGSRIELPRTKSHEGVYAPTKKSRARRRTRHRRNASHRKQSSGPQMWLTTVWHAGTGLPWDWRLGPADSSERQHWLEMLPQLPADALVAADAGFVGYEYARAVIESGRQLLLRVGSHVRLLKHLGHARERQGLVYLWPVRAAQQRLLPLVLRLVVVHNGKHPVYLVTSVLSERRLSEQQVIELYRRRWGIELFYRHLKQTFQRRKLRSASADNARVEMEWSLVGLWAMGLYAQVELARDHVPPEKISVAQVLRAFRRMLRDYRHPVEPGESLCSRLRRALIDDYVRGNKTSRHYPRKKQESPPGPPQIVAATRAQIQLARELRADHQKRLSA